MLCEDDFEPKDDFMLVISPCNDGTEKLIYFSSMQSPNMARMNMLQDSIVVEHTVDCVESATFMPYERREAIKFIESLLYLF